MTNTTPNEQVAVKCDKEAQVNTAPQKESQSVSVAVTGFSLFATTLK
jgi:predicted component of type VI protein secretion system